MNNMDVKVLVSHVKDDKVENKSRPRAGSLPNIFGICYLLKWKNKVRRNTLPNSTEWRQKLTSPSSLESIQQGWKKRSSILDVSFLMEENKRRMEEEARNLLKYVQS